MIRLMLGHKGKVITLDGETPEHLGAKTDQLLRARPELVGQRLLVIWLDFERFEVACWWECLRPATAH